MGNIGDIGPTGDGNNPDSNIAADIAGVLGFLDALGFNRLPVDVPDPKKRVVQALTGPEKAEKEAALAALREEIGDCHRCGLSEERNTIVFGEGNPGARLVFVGEAPGREEDRQGRPFVGEAGKLLTNLINKMGEKGPGFERPDVYIGNIVKCRPPMNRDPLPEEIATCIGFIKRQIDIISPEAIISLGRVSAQSLLQTEAPIGRLRGNMADMGGIPLMPTYHPAYLLRNRSAKHQVWADVLKVLEVLEP